MTSSTKTRRSRKSTPQTAAETLLAPIGTPSISKDAHALAQTPEPQPSGAEGGPELPKGKLGILVQCLRRPQGARIAELTSATGWQAHSVRGAMSGALKARGYVISSQAHDDGRVYRIASSAGSQA